MQLCEGVLVILDKEATPFQRIWCCFEQATVAQGKKLLLDIATVQDGEPELLTDGFAYDNRALPNPIPDVDKVAMYIKGAREKHFPVGLLEKAYAIEVEAGQASVEKDRKLILNSITETDLHKIFDMRYNTLGNFEMHGCGPVVPALCQHDR